MGEEALAAFKKLGELGNKEDIAAAVVVVMLDQKEIAEAIIEAVGTYKIIKYKPNKS